MDIEKLKYPIGPYQIPVDYSPALITGWIADIGDFAQNLKAMTSGLSAEQLQLTYRPGSWSIKQIVHHCADSHMNAYMRFKLTATEDRPVIKPYDENLWSALPDAQLDDISSSLDLLSGLHVRWRNFLKALSGQGLERTFQHPEHGRDFVLKEATANYAWHCNHHLAQVKQAIELKGDFS